MTIWPFTQKILQTRCWKGWVTSHRQKHNRLITLPSGNEIWQPEFTDKTHSWKTGAVHTSQSGLFAAFKLGLMPEDAVSQSAKNTFSPVAVRSIADIIVYPESLTNQLN